MRVLNPNYQAPMGPLAALEQQIRDWFAANTATRAVSFDALRGYFGKSADEWPNGAIDQQLRAWGFEVEP